MRDAGVDDVSRVDEFAQSDLSFDDDECSDFLFTHADARHDNRHDFFSVWSVFVVSSFEEFCPEVSLRARADGGEEVADFFLKENDDGERTDVHEFIEDAAEQSHLKHL